MGLTQNFKIRAALLKQQKGQPGEAKNAYEELYASGVVNAAYMLPYSVILLREGGTENYEKVKAILVKAQKAADLTPDRKQQLWMNYAVACWKLGDHDKAIATLESAHKKAPCGNTYGALGFLYIEAGDTQKALAFNTEALEYDDEDPITLDNMGQVYYRLLRDKEKAREFFDKAHAIKAAQIDTLYFLSRYDLDEGNKDAAAEKLEQALQGRFSPLNYITKEQIETELAALKGEAHTLR
jgi:tetratricopeptide (TPR) repeat protein